MNSRNDFENCLVDALETSGAIRTSQPEVPIASGRAIRHGRQADCREAIAHAIFLRRLRRQYGTTGFLAMPLDQYIGHIGRLAQVVLATDSAASHDISLSSRLKPWILLAQKLDMTVQHLNLWIRMWFAEEFSRPVAGTVMSRGNLSPRPNREMQHFSKLRENASPHEVETGLLRIEALYTAPQRRQLNDVLRIIN